MPITYRKLTLADLDTFIALRIRQLREEGAAKEIDLASPRDRAGTIVACRRGGAALWLRHGSDHGVRSGCEALHGFRF